MSMTTSMVQIYTSYRYLQYNSKFILYAISYSIAAKTCQQGSNFSPFYPPPPPIYFPPILFSRHFVFPPFCFLAILFSRHFVFPPFCFPAILYSRHFSFPHFLSSVSSSYTVLDIPLFCVVIKQLQAVRALEAQAGENFFLHFHSLFSSCRSPLSPPS
jgi:hypothetical protein